MHIDAPDGQLWRAQLYINRLRQLYAEGSLDANSAANQELNELVTMRVRSHSLSEWLPVKPKPASHPMQHWVTVFWLAAMQSLDIVLAHSQLVGLMLGLARMTR